MIIPGNFDTVNNELVFYGAGTITQFDKDGYEVFSQTVHNQVVDTGEDFLIDQTFEDTVTTADNGQIGSICIFEGTPTVAEGTNAATFDAANTIAAGNDNCKEDNTVTTAASIATINPAVFECDGAPNNCDVGDSIDAFGVCQNDVTDNLDFEDCLTEGILFAIIDSADTVLNAGETLDITYNFDITSDFT